MRRFLLEDDIRAIISAPDSNRLMIHTEGGVEVRDFARVVGLAPPVEQLFKCSFDLDYTRRILSDYKYLLFKSRPLTGRTFVQNCVLETRHEHLRQALFISPDAALVENDSGTAFEIAIDHKDRTAVKLLLDAVVRSSRPSARAPFVRSLPTLIDSFPDLVSHFLQELGLEDAETFTRFAYVDQEQKYEGSVDQMARTLWEKYDADLDRDGPGDDDDAGGASSRRGGGIFSKAKNSKAVTAHYVGLPGVASIEVLDAITRQPPGDGMFDNDTVKSVVECLWQHHVRSKWLLHFCQFTLFFLSYFVWSYLVVELVKEEKWFRLGDLWRKGHIINSAPPQTLVLLCLDAYFEIEVLIFLSRELYQFGRNGPIVYLMDMSNIMDLTCMVLLAVMPVLHVHAMGVTAGHDVDDDVAQADNAPTKSDLQLRSRRLRELFLCASMLSLLIVIKLMSYMRADPSIGFIVNMLQQICKDIVNYTILLAIFIIAFSNAFFLLFAQNLTRDVWIPPRTTVAATGLAAAAAAAAGRTRIMTRWTTRTRCSTATS